MPPAKRIKRSASAEPRRSPPMHDEIAKADQIPEMEEELELNPEEIGDLDEALFDEEEVPGSTKTPTKPNFQGGFNAMKQFNGQYYTGMAIGGSHTWKYDEGIFKETKVEPDLWEIDYNVKKHRNHTAPKNSGAPTGTKYLWLFVAQQSVEKLDANTYSTHLRGSKYKLAHKGATASNWNITTVKKMREREIFLLKDAVRRIEGLPPVLASEKVKMKEVAKGQSTLDGMFKKSPSKSPSKSETTSAPNSVKRKS